MTNDPSAAAHLLGLPVELISEIAIFGQHMWLEEKCQKRASAASTLRPLPLILNQDDCRGVTAGIVEECLADKTLLLPEPAHALMDSNSRLRQALRPNTTIWRLANTLLRSVARLAGERSIPPPELTAVGAQFRYGSDIFVGEKICYCALRHLAPFYPTLRVVIISMPWADFMEAGNISVAYFFCRLHSQDASPLEHFDLELHDDVYVSPELLLAYRSPAIQICRVHNAIVFFHGPLLKELNITFPFRNRHFFGPNLLNALNRCPNLELFTFAGACCEMIEVALGNAFEDNPPAAVSMPLLRYLRLLLPLHAGRELLERMILPAGVEIHLEPVFSWRAAASSYATAGPEGLEFPPDLSQLWRYTAALAAPARAAAAFEVPPQFSMPTEGLEAELLRSLSTVALKARFGPRESPQFPEIICFMLSDSVEEVIRVLEHDEHLGPISATAAAKEASRRSIAIRCGPEDYEAGDSDVPEGFGCAVIRYVAELLMGGRAQTPFLGVGAAQSFVLPADSWLPETPDAWRCVLRAFDGIAALNIQSATDACLEGLVTYLQGQEGETPLRSLKTISSPRRPLCGPSDAVRRELEAATNTAARLASGAAVIRWVVGN